MSPALHQQRDDMMTALGRSTIKEFNRTGHIRPMAAMIAMSESATLVLYALPQLTVVFQSDESEGLRLAGLMTASKPEEAAGNELGIQPVNGIVMISQSPPAGMAPTSFARLKDFDLNPNRTLTMRLFSEGKVHTTEVAVHPQTLTVSAGFPPMRATDLPAQGSTESKVSAPSY